jgi:ComF family protein
VVAGGPGPLQQSIAPFAYHHPVDHLVHSLKYRGHLAVARVLGSLLARRIEALGLARGIDVLIPVPLHPSRHAGRTFNQSAEIARWTARGLPCRTDATLATRCRDTRPQVGLPRGQRRGNLAGAFVAAAAVRGLRVAVLDDVLTTGNTVSELGTALLDAGALSVDAWCVCRALAPERVDCAHELEVRRA